jgi:ferrous iron transport protein A
MQLSLQRMNEHPSMNDITLNALIPGERATVQRISSTIAHVRQRLLEMGLVKGTRVELVRFAPMGDPIEVRVKGYRLSLRRLEAEGVIVQKERH